jgi:hypothetical protein
MRVRQARADYIRDGRLQRPHPFLLPAKTPADHRTHLPTIKLDSTPANLLHPHQNQHLEDRTLDDRITDATHYQQFLP